MAVDFDAARAILISLKNQGVHIALDDFGTGYSSLRHLRELPFDVLKTFEPVVRTTQQPYILLLQPSVPAKSIKELIAISAAKPLTYAGSSGTGLGALQRLTTGFEIYTQAGKGTVVRVEVWSSDAPAPAPRALPQGAICAPKSGETACGDAWRGGPVGEGRSPGVAML